MNLGMSLRGFLQVVYGFLNVISRYLHIFIIRNQAYAVIRFVGLSRLIFGSKKRSRWKIFFYKNIHHLYELCIGRDGGANEHIR